MNKLIVLMISVLFSCSATKSDETSYSVIAIGEYGTVENRSFEVLTSTQEFITKIENLSIDESYLEKITAIDFNESTVVGIHLGQKNNGGYSIAIESVTENDKEVVLKVKEIGPKQNQAVTMALTQPFCYVALAKTTKKIEVKFLD